MKRKQALFLFLICLLGFFFYRCDDGTENSNQKLIQLTDQIDSTKYYSYKIDFPDTLHYSGLADAVKSYATAARDSFMAMMPEDTASLRFPWELIVDYNKAFESPRFVAYLTQYYRFTGGAHGMPVTKTFVFDKEKEQLVELKDLFSDSTVLKAISRYARDAIARKVYDAESFQELDSSTKDWVRQGTSADFRYYSAFLPVNNRDDGVTGIKVIFQHYQVAPYAAGMPSIIIPVNVFYRYLAPEYKKVFIQDK